jgi:hypothetical protein
MREQALDLLVGARLPSSRPLDSTGRGFSPALSMPVPDPLMKSYSLIRPSSLLTSGGRGLDGEPAS